MTTSPIALTHYSPGGGRACTPPRRPLEDVLMSVRADAAPSGAGAGGAPRVGLDPADDAVVFDLPGLGDRSLVVTRELRAAVVDGPCDWGRLGAVLTAPRDRGEHEARVVGELVDGPAGWVSVVEELADGRAGRISVARGGHVVGKRRAGALSSERADLHLGGAAAAAAGPLSARGRSR